MPLSDLRLYQRYTARRMLPSRRLEMLLAQIPMVMAQLNGTKVQLSDFLFDPRPDDEPDDIDAAAVVAAVNFTPRKRPPRKDNGDANNGEQSG